MQQGLLHKEQNVPSIPKLPCRSCFDPLDESYSEQIRKLSGVCSIPKDNDSNSSGYGKTELCYDKNTHCI